MSNSGRLETDVEWNDHSRLAGCGFFDMACEHKCQDRLLVRVPVLAQRRLAFHERCSKLASRKLSNRNGPPPDSEITT
jgi:hypothetical protein